MNTAAKVGDPIQQQKIQTLVDSLTIEASGRQGASLALDLGILMSSQKVFSHSSRWTLALDDQSVEAEVCFYRREPTGMRVRFLMLCGRAAEKFVPYAWLERAWPGDCDVDNHQNCTFIAFASLANDQLRSRWVSDRLVVESV